MAKITRSQAFICQVLLLHFDQSIKFWTEMVEKDPSVSNLIGLHGAIRARHICRKMLGLEK